LNVGDEDAETFIKIYSLKSRSEIEALIKNHKGQEYQRGLQKALAEEMTVRIHSEHDLMQAQKATQVFFKGTEEDLRSLDVLNMDGAFADLDTFELPKIELEKGVGILDLLSTKTTVFSSKGEAKKMIAANGFSINKTKYTDIDGVINASQLLHNKYMLLQKGKKNYYVLSVS
jgi:tyrosyl-tRNA synthetase